MEKKKRNFSLLDENNNEIGVYKGRQPRDAALKAATRGHTKIRLREHGTNKVHVFEGSRVKVKAPDNRPSWMPPEIWKPKVKKIGIERLEKKRAKKK